MKEKKKKTKKEKKPFVMGPVPLLPGQKKQQEDLNDVISGLQRLEGEKGEDRHVLSPAKLKYCATFEEYGGGHSKLR